MDILKSIGWLFPFFLLPACHSPYDTLRPAPNADPACVQRFRPVFKSIVYKTDVNVVGNQLSGLLVFKTMPDSSRRVVFISETGPTLFDFEFLPDHSFRVRYCLKKLNRKAVVNTLRKDFELLLMENPGVMGPAVLTDGAALYFPFRSGKETNCFITDPDCRRLLRIEKAGRRKTKVVVGLETFASGMPDSVRIEHRNFTFAIRLKALAQKTPEPDPNN